MDYFCSSYPSNATVGWSAGSLSKTRDRALPPMKSQYLYDNNSLYRELIRVAVLLLRYLLGPLRALHRARSELPYCNLGAGARGCDGREVCQQPRITRNDEMNNPTPYLYIKRRFLPFVT